jgi:polar amino acid transport system permease protein
VRVWGERSALLVLGGVAAWFLVGGFWSAQGWAKVWPFLPLLADGLGVTVRVTLVAALIATLTSVALGIARLSNRRVVRLATGAFIEFFRGTSALVQLFWIFFALPLLPIGLKFSPFVAAVIVLGLNWGSSGAEIVRGAIRAIPDHQRDAVAVLGLGFWRRNFSVIIPQALPIALPPYATLMIDLLKNSALVSVVLVQDLVYWAQQVRVATRETAVIYGLLLVVYFVLTLLIAMVFRILERHVSRGWFTGSEDRRL